MAKEEDYYGHATPMSFLSIYRKMSAWTRPNARIFGIILSTLTLFLVPISLSLHSGANLNVAHAESLPIYISWIPKFFWWVLAFITKHLANLALYIAGLSAKFFTLAIDFSTRGSTYADLDFINTVWAFIRDLVNSTFIFAVLFVSFKELLNFGAPNTAKLKSTLVYIIVAALLINFSLFITKVGVDTSNYLTRAIFCTMRTEEKAENGDIRSLCDPGDILIGGMRIDRLAINEVDEAQAKANAEGSTQNADFVGNSNANKVLIAIGSIIVSIVITVSFFVAAFMFIGRIFVLTLIMATSPIMFASLVVNIPAVKTLQKKWTSTLQSQLTFPIVYMIVIYIAVQFVKTSNFFPKGEEIKPTVLSELMQGSSSGFALLLNFGFLTTILLLGLRMAKEMSGQAQIVGGKLASLTSRATLATTGALGRQTFGRAGGAISRSDTAKTWASSDNRFKRFVGDKVIVGGNRMKEGSWDARGSRAFGATYGAAFKGEKIDIGKASERSFAKNGGELGSGYIGRKIGQTELGRKMGFELTKEGKEKEAARQAGIIEKQSTTSGKIAEAKARLGTKLYDKENKKAREQLLASINEEYKDDPVKRAEALKSAFSYSEKNEKGEEVVTNRFSKDDDFKEARSQLAEAIKKEYKDDPEKAKNLLISTVGQEAYNSKDFDAVRSDLQKGINKKTAKDSAKKVHEGNEKIKTLREEATKATPERLQQINFEISKTEEEVKGHQNTFGQAIKSPGGASVVADLAVKDITALQGQLGKAHLAAIGKKMSTGGYDGDPADVDALNEMLKRMRLDHNTSKDVLKWIETTGIKETSGFQMNFNNEVAELTKKIDQIATTDAAAAAESQKQIQELIRVMGKAELQLMEASTLTHNAVLQHINPTRIQEIAKSTYSGNDHDAQEKLREAIKGITDGSLLSDKTVDERKRYVEALKGNKVPAQAAGPKITAAPAMAPAPKMQPPPKPNIIGPQSAANVTAAPGYTKPAAQFTFKT